VPDTSKYITKYTEQTKPKRKCNQIHRKYGTKYMEHKSSVEGPRYYNIGKKGEGIGLPSLVPGCSSSTLTVGSSPTNYRLFQALYYSASLEF
jgi:hypothetical protein